MTLIWRARKEQGVVRTRADKYSPETDPTRPEEACPDDHPSAAPTEEKPDDKRSTGRES